MNDQNQEWKREINSYPTESIIREDYNVMPTK